MRRLSVLLPAFLLLAATLPAAPAAGVTCPPGNGHVWFVGIAYDSAQRIDFVVDIDHFELYLAKLRQTYCIPDSQAKILAMENNFVRNGKTYPEATEANLKSTLSAFATAANPHSDSILFFFLSSHGLANVPLAQSCPITRLTGSFSALKAGGGEDGYLDDCELGAAFNAFDADTRIVSFVDCSFCGGFSDSTTALSGTLPDGGAGTVLSSGIPKANRIVMTGCAITTECFGNGAKGGRSYSIISSVLNGGVAACDGWTAPGFPAVQGVDVAAKIGPIDGTCTMSEVFFASVSRAYTTFDLIAIQQQFRIKYGFPTLAQDIRIL